MMKKERGKDWGGRETQGYRGQGSKGERWEKEDGRWEMRDFE